MESQHPLGWLRIKNRDFIIPLLNIFHLQSCSALRFDIFRKSSSDISVAARLGGGIWKMPHSLREFTQQHHHHEVAQMNFHLVGAQSPTHSSGLGQERSEFRSRKTTSLVSNTDLWLSRKPLIQMSPWLMFLVYRGKIPLYMWLKWPHFSQLRSQAG